MRCQKEKMNLRKTLIHIFEKLSFNSNPQMQKFFFNLMNIHRGFQPHVMFEDPYFQRLFSVPLYLKQNISLIIQYYLLLLYPWNTVLKVKLCVLLFLKLLIINHNSLERRNKPHENVRYTTRLITIWFLKIKLANTTSAYVLLCFVVYF